MQQQAIKLAAHVETLLDLLLDANAKWAMLRPTLVDKSVIQAWGGGKRKQGLDTIRRSFLHVCVLNIAHIAFESDSRSPSISKVMKDLKNVQTLKLLKKSFVRAWAGAADDPDYLERSPGAELRFDTTLSNAEKSWEILCTAPELKGIKLIRDKGFAHVELMFTAGRYERLNVGRLGLKWRDIGEVLLRIEPIVLALNSICRHSEIDMADSRKNFENAAEIFWAPRSST